jgi:4-hydroxy-tetrahydrodipicolinate reductase
MPAEPRRMVWWSLAMSDMKIAVLGAGGRMGQALARVLADTPGCALTGGIEAKGSPYVGRDIGEVAGLEPVGIAITDDPLPVFAAVDGVLDFTTPASTLEFVALSAQARLVHVIGTTGLSAADEAKIEAAARHATIVKAGNMSLGVNLLAALTARVAAALGAEFDIEILEMHHKHKRDAPSGTSLMLGRAAAEARGISLKDRAVWTRDGDTGPRRDGDIGFAALRGGDVVGEHRVIFAGPGERIELAHIATDRGIFARGAVKAALWARGREPGLYSMQDVLGLGQDRHEA